MSNLEVILGAWRSRPFSSPARSADEIPPDFARVHLCSYHLCSFTGSTCNDDPPVRQETLNMVPNYISSLWSALGYWAMVSFWCICITSGNPYGGTWRRNRCRGRIGVTLLSITTTGGPANFRCLASRTSRTVQSELLLMSSSGPLTFKGNS